MKTSFHACILAAAASGLGCAPAARPECPTVPVPPPSAPSVAGAASPTLPVVTYLPKDKVAAAFAKGGPLYAFDDGKVMAGHRDDAKGAAEIHVKDTDVFYILEGSATFVTGGELVDGAPKAGEPDEIRGPSIRGGEPRKLEKGDVIVIPHGVPHHFTEVTGPLNYFVVKVR
jgi:mannose-6-phosphate isomerase-like protein (cupin superfamily)